MNSCEFAVKESVVDLVNYNAARNHIHSLLAVVFVVHAPADAEHHPQHDEKSEHALVRLRQLFLQVVPVGNGCLSPIGLLTGLRIPPPRRLRRTVSSSSIRHRISAPLRLWRLLVLILWLLELRRLLELGRRSYCWQKALVRLEGLLSGLLSRLSWRSVQRPVTVLLCHCLLAHAYAQEHTD